MDHIIKQKLYLKGMKYYVNQVFAYWFEPFYNIYRQSR